MSAHTAVFGHDVKFTEDGKPVEKGIGAIKPEAVTEPVDETQPEAGIDVDNEFGDL